MQDPQCHLLIHTTPPNSHPHCFCLHCSSTPEGLVFSLRHFRALIISMKTVFISLEVRIVGLSDADRLAVLQGCPGIPGASGPKGEPGLPGMKGEAPKASNEHCDTRCLCCFGWGRQAEAAAGWPGTGFCEQLEIRIGVENTPSRHPEGWDCMKSPFFPEFCHKSEAVLGYELS